MCVDTANCAGTCDECMSDSVRRLTMANKQLTKMCDQYLAELAAERQRSRLPEELVERLRRYVYPSDWLVDPGMWRTLAIDVLAAVERDNNE